MNIPDNIEAEGRWPHDHLFIDQDGIPTQPLRSGRASLFRDLFYCFARVQYRTVYVSSPSTRAQLA